MFLSCLLIDTGDNPDRPRPGRLWLRNLYRVHQRLCMAFPSTARIAADEHFLHPFTPGDFADGHVHIARTAEAGFLYRVDPRPPARAVILVQSAIEPDWNYAFKNACHLLAATPRVRPWNPAFTAGQRLRFRLRANPVRRARPVAPERPGPRVPVPPTPEGLRAWLERRAPGLGFSLDESTIATPGYIYWSKSSAKGEGVRLRSVLYEGALTVLDPHAFRNAIESGIGPAKAFGFGLLSIAPA